MGIGSARTRSFRKNGSSQAQKQREAQTMGEGHPEHPRVAVKAELVDEALPEVREVDVPDLEEEGRARPRKRGT